MNVELYNKLYNIRLEDFEQIFNAFKTEDEEEISKTVLGYLDGFLEDPKYPLLTLFEEVVRVVGAQPPKEDSFEFNGVEYFAIDLDSLTTAEFIDLQNYIVDFEMVKLATILYRPKEDLNNYQGTYKYKDAFKDIPFYLVVGGIRDFVSWNKQNPEKYPYLYSKEEVEEDINNISYTEADEFAEEFSWMSMIYTCAKEGFLNISGHKDVLSSPADEFLAFMNFYKRKCQVETNMIKQK